MMKTRILLATMATIVAGHAAQAAPMESNSATTTYHRVTVDGVGVFYREAGPKDVPTIVLLHGFPSSSREFDTLIPLLATRYHLIAPDFPGFGQSEAPPPSSYSYTFDHLAKTTNALLELLKIGGCIFYLHDYGGPVGFRIFLAHPERVQALIIQNANAYEEGLGAKWAGIAQYWADPKAHPEVFDAFVRSPIETGPTRDPSGPALRLPHERHFISRMASVVARAQTADSGGLGTERSLVHRGRGRGVQARSA
jgi:pimeloyl-ACP methyl ester carboxylesterase